MRKVLQGSLLVTVALALAGCFELTDVITLNPDGSGKAQIDQVVSPPPNMMGGPNAAKPDADKMAKAAVGSLLGGMKNIEAWSDVSYEVLKDGKIHVKATGYFPDVAKFSAMPGGGGDDQGVKWAKDDKGGMTLEFNMQKPPQAPAAAPPQLTDAQVQEQLQQARAAYQQSKPMMTMILDGLKIDMTFRLPGKIEEVNNFKKTDQGVQMVMEGKKIMEVMDKFMADDKAMAASIRAGKKGDDGPDNMNEQLFGSKGNLTARVSGELKPQFDYKAEMEKAKAGQAEMLKKLGVEIAAPGMPMGPGGPPGP